MKHINIHEQLTLEAIHSVQEILRKHPVYEAAKLIAREYLGARKLDLSLALFGFWTPGLMNGELREQAHQITLELFTPLEPLDFRALKKNETLTAVFQRDEVRLAPVDDYLIGVVNNVAIGTKHQAGSFYWLRYQKDGTRHLLRDPLVQSAPFGIYAPAEIFDLQAMLAGRKDMKYFRQFYKTIFPDGTYRAKDVGVHLEIHPETATEAGTIEALTRRYRDIGQKIQANLDAGKEDIYAGLDPADLNFIGFDSIELTPEVPPAEREAVTQETGEFFQILDERDGRAQIALKRPDFELGL